ncbi:MAG TPA: STAS domain-containing protein [Terriglobales bacterium]|nr:STAS domain-containing protein [Terriglobales bacterium]
MLEYTIRQSGDVTLVDLKGPITLGEALAHGLESGTESPRPVVIGEIIRQLLRQGRRKILLNLTDVTYIDSSGIGELVGAFTSVQRHGGQLKLLNPLVRVVDVLRLTRLDHLFPVESDEGAAIQSFAKSVASG